MFEGKVSNLISRIEIQVVNADLNENDTARWIESTNIEVDRLRVEIELNQNLDAAARIMNLKKLSDAHDRVRTLELDQT